MHKPRAKTRNLIAVALLSSVATLVAVRVLPINTWLNRWVLPQDLQSILTTRESELIGHTDYTTYLTASKQALSGQTQLLTATVTREETMTQTIERELLPQLPKKFTSTASIAIHYTAEYAYGYNLDPQAFDIKSGAQGIEIHLKAPTLLTTPAVSKLTHEVLSSGLLTDETAATLKLYEQAATQAQKNGEALQTDPAVMALCEKKLIAFLADFWVKQNSGKLVPYMQVVYKDRT